jgi:VWFA-related protein
MFQRDAKPLLLALLSLGPASAWARQAPTQGESPTFPTEIERVMVDVVVEDGKDRPVTTLGRDDFRLLEDGTPQTLETFEVVRVPEATPAATEAPRRVATNAPGEAQPGSTFVVVFDDLHISVASAPRAKAAIAAFLKTAAPDGDRVWLVATSGAAWWSETMPDGRDDLLRLLKRLDARWVPDRSPDRIEPWEAMRIDLYHDPIIIGQVTARWKTYEALQPQSGAQSPDGSSPSTTYENPQILARAASVHLQDVSRNRNTLALLERALDSMAAVPGRKSMVLMSEGFTYDPTLDEFKRVLNASRRSNTALYFIDARGLEGMPDSDTAEFGGHIDSLQTAASLFDQPLAAEGADKLAGDSGGFTVRNTNDLQKGLTRIASESRAYYLLGYHSTNHARDGRFRKIEVDVRRKGVDVRARKGYFAPLDASRTSAREPKQKGDPALQRALDSPADLAEIPLRASAFVFDQVLLGQAKVVVAAELDIRKLAFQERDGRLLDDVDVLFALAHRESGASFRKDERVAMKLLPEAPAKLARDWYPVSEDFDLAPGRYRARVVMRDRNNGHVGSVTSEFDVPEGDRLRLSTPLIGDVLQKTDRGQHPPLLLRRTYRPGAMLFCEYQVYGATRDATGVPRVAAGYEIRRSDGGTVIARVEPNLIRPTSLGALSRLFAAPLAGASPGAYELTVSATDEVAGTTVEAREPFVIEGPEAP